MRRVLWIAAWLSAGIAGWAAEAGKGAVWVELNKSLAQYEKIEGRNFRVQVRCPEVEALLAARLPIAWQPDLVLISENGTRTLKPNLDTLPAPYRALAESELWDRARVYSRGLEVGTPHTLYALLKMARDAAQFDVIKFDDAALDLQINELNEPFFDRPMRSVRIKINRLNSTIERFECGFDSNQYMRTQWHHAPQETPGSKTPALFPDRVEVEQTAFATGNQATPRKFTISFNHYEFAPVEAQPWKAKLEQAGLISRQPGWFRQDEGGRLHLNLRGTTAHDLSALKGLPVEELHLSSTLVADLKPLAGMPLRILLLDGCRSLQDLTPLAECQQLEKLAIPGQCADIAFLRKLPRLRFLCYNIPTHWESEEAWVPAYSTTEFWKAYRTREKRLQE